MPKVVGAFEAKTHFSELLDQVEQGNEITITRHGQAIAVLIPKQRIAQKQTWQALIKELKHIRKNQDRGRKAGTSVKELLEAGRK